MSTTETSPIFNRLFNEQPRETQNIVGRALTAAANRRFQANQERRQAEALAALAAKLNGAER